MSGLEMAVLYGLKPHQLGFCGPHRKKEKMLRDFLEGAGSPAKVRNVLKQFKAAYPYYCLIAKANKIKDPFDTEVVRAYWIGNNLLENVPVSKLRKTISVEFSGFGLLPKAIAQKKAAEIPEDSLPHHSFHVLALGAISSAVDLRDVKLKDLCRVSWGQIKKITVSERVQILASYQPLTEKDKKIVLGQPTLREFFGEKKFLPDLKIGDYASFHWNQIIQILTKDEVDNLKKYTQKTLSA
jgi:hypothetical protein